MSGITEADLGEFSPTPTWDDVSAFYNDCTFAVPSGATRLLVRMCVESGGGGARPYVRWNGTDLTNRAYAANSNTRLVEIWDLIDPEPGTHVLRYGGASNAKVKVLALTGDDPGDPLVDLGAAGYSFTQSLAEVAGAESGARAYDALAMDSTTPTADAGQTVEWEGTQAGGTRFGFSAKTASGSDVSMLWTHGDGFCAHAMVVYLPGAAPAADVAGSVALSLTATGSIAVAKPVSGSVAVALATSGSIAVAKPVAGGVGLALSATGAIAVNKPVAGSVAMGVACSGALTVPKPVAGSVAVGLTAAGSVAVAKPVSGAVAVALTTSGALTTVGMGGAVAVSVATAGSVAVAKPVSGAVLVSLTTTAALTIAKPVSGNVALSLVTSGSVQVAKPVAGAVSVALTAAGAVQVPKLLGGAVSVSLTAGGSVAVAKPVGGAVLLSLTTTGRIETATLRGLVTAVLTLRSTPTALTLRPTDATLTTRAGAAALTLRPAADAALQFQTDDPV